MGSDVPETVEAIVAAHRAGSATPVETVARSYRRIRDHNDPAIFIALRDEKDALAEAGTLSGKDASAPKPAGISRKLIRSITMPWTRWHPLKQA